VAQQPASQSVGFVSGREARSAHKLFQWGQSVSGKQLCVGFLAMVTIQTSVNSQAIHEWEENRRIYLSHRVIKRVFVRV
jgi:hypothetical protein